MTGLLLQTGKLSPIQEAVRNQFQEGGSPVTALFIVVGMVAVIILAYWLTKAFRLGEAPTVQRRDPMQLYQELSRKLSLSETQLLILDSVVEDLRLEEPARLLMSAAMFDRCIDQWREHRSRSADKTGGIPSRQAISKLRIALFLKTS
ncbi:MAG: hypothetical protein JSU63_19200 [Phycisphaerales bacterium]|nr:MAG: hypothetical protein JSU63_19200 [Phycisphaerales bacterium]